MSLNQKSTVGIMLIVGAALWASLSQWDLLISYIPAAARPYLEAPVTAILLAAVGVYFLWQAATAAGAMERKASDALDLANKSNAHLKRRVEDAERKLTTALDEQIINWAPAHQRLTEEAAERLRITTENYKAQLREVYLSAGRKGVTSWPDPPPDDEAPTDK